MPAPVRGDCPPPSWTSPVPRPAWCGPALLMSRIYWNLFPRCRRKRSPMVKEPVVIALDLGGSNARWALVTRQGKLLDRWEHPTSITPDQEVFLSSLATDLKVCGQKAQAQGAEVQGVGLGVPGRILPSEGVVAFSPNIPGLNACPLVPSLTPLVPWPLSLENDANLFALGEHWLGAGAGFSEMLGITLGTGVGGGLILNGRIWGGAGGRARGGGD